MNVGSGVFTAPVPGTYHFSFSAVKDTSKEYLIISIQVNGKDCGRAYTELSISGNNARASVSLAASFYLKAGDQVNMRNEYGGTILDTDNGHHTHFTGWLVNEELMLA